MSKKKKEKSIYPVYYVSPENESANSAVEDIAGFCIHVDFERDLTVYDLDQNGEQKEIRKNLARMPSVEGITILNANRSRKGLKFKVFHQESPGSKIIRWYPDWKRTAKKAALKRASSL